MSWVRGKRGEETGRGRGRRKKERKRETDSVCHNHHHVSSFSVSPGSFPYGPLSGGIPRAFFWRYHFYTVHVPAMQRCKCQCPSLGWHVCKQLLPSPQFAMMGIFVQIGYPDLSHQASSCCCVRAFPTVCTVQSCQVC